MALTAPLQALNGGQLCFVHEGCPDLLFDPPFWTEGEKGTTWLTIGPPNPELTGPATEILDQKRTGPIRFSLSLSLLFFHYKNMTLIKKGIDVGGQDSLMAAPWREISTSPLALNL